MAEHAAPRLSMQARGYMRMWTAQLIDRGFTQPQASQLAWVKYWAEVEAREARRQQEA